MFVQYVHYYLWKEFTDDECSCARENAHSASMRVAAVNKLVLWSSFEASRLHCVVLCTREHCVTRVDKTWRWDEWPLASYLRQTDVLLTLAGHQVHRGGRLDYGIRCRWQPQRNFLQRSTADISLSERTIPVTCTDSPASVYTVLQWKVAPYDLLLIGYQRSKLIS